MTDIKKQIELTTQKVIGLARTASLRLATAESCTGGGIGAAITAQAGSSDVFVGGVISYANSVKENVLGVPRQTLIHHGAVSEQAALAMADGAHKLLGADLAVSVTGIAGPSGGSPEKPVGTVWIGLAQKGHATKAQHFHFKVKDRKAVRQATILAALEMLAKALRT